MLVMFRLISQNGSAHSWESRKYTDSFPPSILVDLVQVLKTSFSWKEISERAGRHRLEPLPLHQTARAHLSAILRQAFDSITCAVGVAEYGRSPGVATTLSSGQGEERGDSRKLTLGNW